MGSIPGPGWGVGVRQLISFSFSLSLLPLSLKVNENCLRVRIKHIFFLINGFLGLFGDCMLSWEGHVARRQGTWELIHAGLGTDPLWASFPIYKVRMGKGWEE